MALASGLGASAARAADPAEESLIKEGVEARRRQDDAVALELFVRAYALHHSPRAAAQMGLAEIALGRWLEAEEHLQEATAADRDPWIKKNASVLSESLDRVHQEIGSLEILGSPEGAEVVIAGEVRGTLPLPKPLHVRAGDVRFELRATGYEPDTRTVRVLPGQFTRETMKLARLPPVIPGTGAAPGSAPRPAVPVVSSAPPASGPSRESTGAGLRLTGGLLAGAGVIAAGAGLAFGFVARAAGDTDSQNATFDPGADRTGHRYETLQWIGYAAGGALLAGGAVTYFIGTRAREDETAVSLTIVPTGSGGLGLLRWKM